MSVTLYNSALVLHIIGITVMAGTTFIDFITTQAFYRLYSSNRSESFVLENYLQKLQRFLGIGMLLLLISGITMMVKLHELWGAQLWFRIKMVLLLIIIFNGLGLRRRLGNELRRWMTDNTSVATKEQRPRAIRNLTWVQVIQLILFLVVFVLSAFKFN
ncbi:hypothetical protein RYH73_09605 [Olivibacter sp. CPCC 100613]|uniref:DUF2269 family protein n=1 Tax=Olivibacter sp. CPCC 100613 TaxID=3079931 RepID=UPI002FF757A6